MARSNQSDVSDASGGEIDENGSESGMASASADQKTATADDPEREDVIESRPASRLEDSNRAESEDSRSLPGNRQQVHGDDGGSASPERSTAKPRSLSLTLNDIGSRCMRSLLSEPSSSEPSSSDVVANANEYRNRVALTEDADRASKDGGSLASPFVYPPSTVEPEGANKSMNAPKVLTSTTAPGTFSAESLSPSLSDDKRVGSPFEREGDGDDQEGLSHMGQSATSPVTVSGPPSAASSIPQSTTQTSTSDPFTPPLQMIGPPSSPPPAPKKSRNAKMARRDPQENTRPASADALGVQAPNASRNLQHSPLRHADSDRWSHQLASSLQQLTMNDSGSQSLLSQSSDAVLRAPAAQSEGSLSANAFPPSPLAGTETNNIAVTGNSFLATPSQPSVPALQPAPTREARRQRTTGLRREPSSAGSAQHGQEEKPEGSTELQSKNDVDGQDDGSDE
ncbi:hypothetical protein Cob_v009184 [Colletotrichum orbiculare MAFF 240422]|uniref:Uncharacterized protein n=1 Tax=Colletotrichum orbiculare (strain 104-T / ATCC 96160 / CBS 514.97 / LARS 414 / MAFF 240422) TaxID=1213857 RepID=N4VKD6_COLOR|nr:hypothetical protein Cob_v009184 [Colletotrichum orbiculare MAFF 240422]